MQIQTKQKRAQLASLLATIATTTFAATLFATSIQAGGFEPIQRLGRNCGFGWGDGYHACKSSGCRPGADLPPRSYSKQFSGGCLPGSLCASKSFYDQFDAGANLARRGCDHYGCDAGANAGSDYGFSNTYVVANRSQSHSNCDSASCDDPSCDHMGCDGSAAAYVPAAASGGQAWTPPAAYAAPASNANVGSPPAASINVPAETPSYAQPMTQPTPAQVWPSERNLESSSSAVNISNEDADATTSSPSDRKLTLPEPGFSENESSESEFNGELPAPGQLPQQLPSIESIPAPTPDSTPDAGSQPNPTANPPMPESMGPLDASLSPNGNMPEGWSEKPVSTNPFLEQDPTTRVKMPAALDLIPESTDDEDDLLLFDSVQLNAPPVNRPPARVAQIKMPQRLSTARLPQWTATKADDLGLNGPKSGGESTKARPRSIPSSLFITQPE